MRRIGIFGGTFDPVHIGHLVAATWCRDDLELDLIMLTVANEPWQKVGTRRVSSPEDRFSVLQAAVESVDRVEASRLELDRGGPSYTADTVRELEERFPEAELYVVVGSDVASELRSWQRIDEFEDRVTLVVVDRGGVVPGAPAGEHSQWSGRKRKVRMPTIELSSSELRQRLRDGLSVDFLIPEPAIRRIRDLGMYSVGR